MFEKGKSFADRLNEVNSIERQDFHNRPGRKAVLQDRLQVASRLQSLYQISLQ
jgi:hypothetical protein